MEFGRFLSLGWIHESKRVSLSHFKLLHVWNVFTSLLGRFMGRKRVLVSDWVVFVSWKVAETNPVAPRALDLAPRGCVFLDQEVSRVEPRAAISQARAAIFGVFWSETFPVVPRAARTWTRATSLSQSRRELDKLAPRVCTVRVRFFKRV